MEVLVKVLRSSGDADVDMPMLDPSREMTGGTFHPLGLEERVVCEVCVRYRGRVCFTQAETPAGDEARYPGKAVACSGKASFLTKSLSDDSRNGR